MIRQLLISILFLLTVPAVKAQTVDSLFTAIPNTYLPLLDYNSRLDLLDFYNCGMTAKVYNDLGGEASLLEKDSLHLVVQTTASSSFEFQLLFAEKDTLYSCVRTVEMPEKQSQIVFLNTQWYPEKVRMPKDLSFARFWTPNDSLSEDRIESLRQALYPTFLKIHWETEKGGTPILVYQVSVEGLLPNDQKDASSCLRPLRFVWSKGQLQELEP